MKLSRDMAFELLTEGLENPEKIQYVTHCKYVGELAGLIAKELGENAEYASVLGFLHDIGRKVDPANHAYAGYVFLKEKGYSEYADICLTHSFLNNDIRCTAGMPFPTDHPAYDFIEKFVREHSNTVYDRIIQTCDLLCLHSGGTTLEERLADIETRKGRFETAEYHYLTAAKQMKDIEEKLGHSIYDFYGSLK